MHTILVFALAYACMLLLMRSYEDRRHTKYHAALASSRADRMHRMQEELWDVREDRGAS